jgi:predicted MFS family arabinose efflux permease
MPSKKQEWAAMWPLPFTALLGVAGSAIFAYSNGVFMIEMTREFGWSRTEFSSAFAVQTVLGLVIVPLAGRLTDRIGPRKVVLAGLIPYIIAFSLLGTATGSFWQWLVLCLILALCTAPVAPPVWLAAVVARFTASRGLALSVALAGVGVANGLAPILATWYTKLFGWRLAFPALVLSWGVAILPLSLVWFLGPRDLSGAAPIQPRATLRYSQVFKTRTFIFLTIAGSLICSVVFGLTLHLVPILRGNGLSPSTAAAMAGVVGIFAIAGRIGTGYLLDNLPARFLATGMFLLPILVSALLKVGGESLVSSVIAAAFLGVTAGAETDVVCFLAARQFGTQVFASVYAVISAMFSICAACGPLLASALYDLRGSYDLFLIVTVPVTLVAAGLICALPPMSLSTHSGSIPMSEPERLG